jgi:hypothetical protein
MKPTQQPKKEEEHKAKPKQPKSRQPTASYREDNNDDGPARDYENRN